MTNTFYNASGAPTQTANGVSATMRSEFDAIETGFDGVAAALSGSDAINFDNNFTVNGTLTNNGTMNTTGIVDGGGVSTSRSLSIAGSINPPAVSIGYTLYVDFFDNKLKAKSAAGKITILALPS